jgi:hypothetical protein
MAIVQDKSFVNPTDRKLSSANRTAANVAAIVALTPQYPGEIARALDTGQQFMATGPLVGNWALLSELATE